MYGAYLPSHKGARLRNPCGLSSWRDDEKPTRKSEPTRSGYVRPPSSRTGRDLSFSFSSFWPLSDHQHQVNKPFHHLSSTGNIRRHRTSLCVRLRSYLKSVAWESEWLVSLFPAQETEISPFCCFCSYYYYCCCQCFAGRKRITCLNIALQEQRYRCYRHEGAPGVPASFFQLQL